MIAANIRDRGYFQLSPIERSGFKLDISKCRTLFLTRLVSTDLIIILLPLDYSGNTQNPCPLSEKQPATQYEHKLNTRLHCGKCIAHAQTFKPKVSIALRK